MFTSIPLLLFQGQDIYNVVYQWGAEGNDISRPLRYGCRTPYDRSLCNHNTIVSTISCLLSDWLVYTVYFTVIFHLAVCHIKSYRAIIRFGLLEQLWFWSVC